MRIINIIVADNYPVVVSGICEFVKSTGDIRVVATCSHGVKALEKIRELTPTIAILGLSLAKISGLDVLATINRENLPTRVLFFTASIFPCDIITAMAEGAYGVLSKEAKPHEFLHCIREIAVGRKCLPFELLGHAYRTKTSAAPTPIEKLLTPHEWKVMKLAAEGLSNKDIGLKLNITAGTAKNHLHRIFEKVGVKNRTALASLLIQASSNGNAVPSEGRVPPLA